MVTEITRVIAERIAEARSRGATLTDAELARRLGIARATLQTKLGGFSDFKLSELSALCRVIGTDLEALVRDLPRDAA